MGEFQLLVELQREGSANNVTTPVFLFFIGYFTSKKTGLDYHVWPGKGMTNMTLAKPPSHT